MSENRKQNIVSKTVNRRAFLKGTALGLASLAIPIGTSDASIWESFFQKRFREMNEDEIRSTIIRLEKEYKREYKTHFNIKTTKPLPGVKYGYGLDISRCIGCRRCVYACVKENNQSRDPQIHWITVLRFKKGEKWVSVLEEAEKYYYPEKVPEEGYFYMPVQCQQCDNSPCERVCPTKATYRDHDGIVLIDYNWCIGCRYCMAACPYGARRFNWGEPRIPKDELNTEVHYFGNRPRYRGVVEKCTFCIQRVRETPGRYPACVEICPVGARKFGNLLDPKSEIRYCIENKRVFRLKEDLNTSPKFYYFFAT
ncbi:MAG: 4Fe-4S dicluster domain-containing protein [Candidatus Mariimomonas ferrooxydans]